MFTLFYCLLGLSCVESNVIPLYVLCFAVNGYVCLVCCVSDNVCDMFDETICNMFGCCCHFVVV